MELYEGNQYKDEVVLLKKEKDRLSDKVDTLWKELKDHQDVIHATEKEHLDLRQELESQIRDKDEEIKTLKIQITSLEKSRYVLTYLKKRRSNFDKGPIHLPHLRIRKFFYGQLESYGSVSTYRRLETYGSINHDLIFFGSKCLKLPNSLRKVVKLRSKFF